MRIPPSEGSSSCLVGEMERYPCTERNSLISKCHLQFYNLPYPPSWATILKVSTVSGLTCFSRSLVFYTCRCSPWKSLKCLLKVLSFFFSFHTLGHLKCSHGDQSHKWSGGSVIDQIETTDWFKWLRGTKAFARHQQNVAPQNCPCITKTSSKSVGYQSFGRKSGAIRSLGAGKVEKPYFHCVDLIGCLIYGFWLRKQKS